MVGVPIVRKNTHSGNGSVLAIRAISPATEKPRHPVPSPSGTRPFLGRSTRLSRHLIESKSPSSESKVVSLSDGLGANTRKTYRSEDPCYISKEISLSESQQESPCGACQEMVGAGSDFVACDGPCQTWYHLKCTDLSNEDFLWYCHGFALEWL